MTQEKEPPLVLVVDDTEANLDLLVEVLGDQYEVSVATDGESTLEAAAEDPPELILLDIMMPGMDGYEVCRRLKENPATRDIPVIFVTAKTETADEARGFELGAVDYITKPISPPIVLARVATQLQLHRQNRELARQNRLLKKYTRMRDDVERMTRHDLKSPLTAVIGVPEMLMEEANITPDQKDLLQMLRESGYRMLHIVNSSLDLYKMETGRYQLRPEPVDAVKVANQIRGETRELMRRKNVGVLMMVDSRPAREGDSLWISGEEMLLYTMLANLVKNAVEASPEGENVTISMEQGDPARIIVHNQGTVPGEIRDKFFSKYATAGKKDGTGLGTYTARLIATTLGGDIAMASSEAQGTAITLALPPSAQAGRPGEADAAQPSAAPAGADGAAASPLSKQGEGPSILVVDDYANMRRITRSALHRLGYDRILVARDGEDALAKLASNQVDLIISDVNMPNMNGLELLRAVRDDAATADLPFIMVTGESDQQIILAAAKARVSDYIIKPYSPDTLEAKINKVMGRA